MKDIGEGKLLSNQTLSLNDPLTIHRINELKGVIYGAMVKSRDILIDNSSCSEFDFSYIQLLCSSVITSKDDKTKLSLKPSESLNKILFEAGFDKSGFFDNQMLPLNLLGENK